jgi:polysaccharide export outer membrane protein
MNAHTRIERPIWKRSFKPIALLIMASMALGCVIPPHRVVVNEAPLKVACQVTKYFPMRHYQLSSGDVLEFVYMFLPSTHKKKYKIQAEDQIDIEFNFHPELNRTVRVRPDGGVSIPRKKDMKIAGMTTNQAKAVLEKKYSDLLKDPEITVTVREFQTTRNELREAITTGANGQTRQVPIDPDGHISLPMIPAVKATNRTVPELTNEINSIYSRLAKGVQVSVMLRTIVGNVFFVDGEVTNPGVYTATDIVSVQQAIARAGGMTDTAEPRTVLVVSKGPQGRFITRTANLSLLTSGQDFPLRRGDLVYVPKSYISRANTWVDQNIRQLLLFNGWSLGLSGTFGRGTP